MNLHPFRTSIPVVSENNSSHKNQHKYNFDRRGILFRLHYLEKTHRLSSSRPLQYFFFIILLMFTFTFLYEYFVRIFNVNSISIIDIFLAWQHSMYVDVLNNGNANPVGEYLALSFLFTFINKMVVSYSLTLNGIPTLFDRDLSPILRKNPRIQRRLSNQISILLALLMTLDFLAFIFISFGCFWGYIEKGRSSPYTYIFYGAVVFCMFIIAVITPVVTVLNKTKCNIGDLVSTMSKDAERYSSEADKRQKGGKIPRHSFTFRLWQVIAYIFLGIWLPLFFIQILIKFLTDAPILMAANHMLRILFFVTILRVLTLLIVVPDCDITVRLAYNFIPLVVHVVIFVQTLYISVTIWPYAKILSLFYLLFPTFISILLYVFLGKYAYEFGDKKYVYFKRKEKKILDDIELIGSFLRYLEEKDKGDTWRRREKRIRVRARVGRPSLRKRLDRP